MCPNKTVNLVTGISCNLYVSQNVILLCHITYKYWLLFYLLFPSRTQTGICPMQLPGDWGEGRRKGCGPLSQLCRGELPPAPVKKHLSKGCKPWSRRHLIYRNMNFLKVRDWKYFFLMQFNLLVAPHFYMPCQASSVQITWPSSLQTHIENPQHTTMQISTAHMQNQPYE